MDLKTLAAWVNINSGSHNPAGLARMADALTEALQPLPGTLERVPLSQVVNLDGSKVLPGAALKFTFRPDAPVQVLFSGHMDTVFGQEHHFQNFEELEGDRVTGPGVTDMKGGLFIMITAVSKLLEDNLFGNIGGTILITADEEIGSPGSHDLLLKAAAAADLGLVFESALPGGELVCARKGTGTFRFTATGKAAHTGRDFEKGRNALTAMASLMLKCHALNTTIEDAIVNVGSINGGGPVNVVPDAAEAWVNVRVGKIETVPLIESTLKSLIKETMDEWDGVHLEMAGDIARPPKEESPADARLHEIWNEAENKLGLPESGKRSTGGSSDGNLFSEVDLPHLDAIGIRGGDIHSAKEFALLDSIPGQVDKVIGFLEIISKNPDRLIKSKE